MGQKRNKKKSKNKNKKSWDKQKWNTTYPNVCNVAKTVLRRKFIPINAYTKTKERS